MEKILIFLFALAVQPLFIVFFLVTFNTVRYIVEEINHSWKVFKRSVREAAWDLEWKIKLLKRR
jgi:hypothetical protein